MNRLTWKEGPYNSHYGRVGSVSQTVFNLYWDSGQWRIVTAFPGFKARINAGRDLAVAKEHAERLLEMFVQNIGATFTNGENES